MSTPKPRPVEDAWVHRKWYAYRVQPGSFIDRSTVKGTPYLNIPLTVTSEDMYGSKIDHQMWLTDNPKQIRKNAETLKLLGMDVLSEEHWNDVAAGGQNTIVAAEIEGQIEIGEFNGREQVRVGRFRVKRGESPEALTGEVAEMFKKGAAAEEEGGSASMAEDEDWS